MGISRHPYSYGQTQPQVSALPLNRTRTLVLPENGQKAVSRLRTWGPSVPTDIPKRVGATMCDTRSACKDFLTGHWKVGAAPTLVPH